MTRSGFERAVDREVDSAFEDLAYKLDGIVEKYGVTVDDAYHALNWWDIADYYKDWVEDNE